MKQTFKGINTSGKPILKESANRITANILMIVNMQPNCAAYRVNNMGVWDEKKQVWRRSNTKKGLPDVWACVYGFFITIEVKAGDDYLKEDQEHRAFEIQRAKGTFFEARSTDSFSKWFPDYLRRKKAEYEALEKFRNEINETHGKEQQLHNVHR